VIIVVFLAGKHWEDFGHPRRADVSRRGRRKMSRFLRPSPMRADLHNWNFALRVS